MNTDSFEREKELEQVRRKLQAMENLNRALQKEREALKTQVNGGQASAAIR
jgi:cell division septum initiation protein DivIVA